MNNISNSITANSVRGAILINGKTFNCDIKKTNGEHKLLAVIPALLDFTDTIKSCELRIWHRTIIDLFRCFCEGGYIEEDDLINIQNMGQKLLQDEYIKFVIITCFRQNNFEFMVDPKLSDNDQLIVANKKMLAIKHQLFVNCLSNVTVYDAENNHVLLNTINNIYYIFGDEESKIYELCFKSLKIQFQQLLFNMISKVIVKKKTQDEGKLTPQK